MLSIPPTLRTRTTIITERVYTLTGADIINLLIKSGVLTETQHESGPEVTFRIPGGGDYSNCVFEVDGDNPVVVTIVDRKET